MLHEPEIGHERDSRSLANEDPRDELYPQSIYLFQEIAWRVKWRLSSAEVRAMLIDGEMIASRIQKGIERLLHNEVCHRTLIQIISMCHRVEILAAGIGENACREQGRRITHDQFHAG